MIKIICSIPNFYWTLEYTQKDIHYLPYPYGTIPKYVHSNVTYINNPYTFKQNKTNYNWYIILHHINKQELPKFYYIYIDSNKNESIKENISEAKNNNNNIYSDYIDNEKGKENEKEGENKNKIMDKISFIQSPIFRVSILGIITIICVIVYCINIKKKKPTTEDLFKEMELGQLSEEEVNKNT